MERDEKSVISVIVPVYNVEPYLRRCLESISNQTYRDLEIIVIDDGSTDGSGRICDEYRDRDERITVFHTENRGLSSARNLGLKVANGKWIGFVDSDDWIESDMYEILLQKAQSNKADVVECGIYLEYPNKVEEQKCEDLVLYGMEAVYALLQHTLTDSVWNKLWRYECFRFQSFPEGRIYEDVDTTYRIIKETEIVCSISAVKYHYLQRETGLSKIHDIQNIIGHWRAHKDRYDALEKLVDDSLKQILLQSCAVSASRAWINYLDYSSEERKCAKEYYQEMNTFTKRNIPLFGNREWIIALRVGVVFPHFYGLPSFRIAWFLGHAFRFVKKKKRFYK